MDQQQQQQEYAPPVPGGGGGSYGPVIGVLAAVMVLGVFAGVLGRLCTGRRIWGYGGGFDCEDWLERKCAACIDGRTGNPPPPPPPPPQQQTNGTGSSAVAAPPAASADAATPSVTSG